MRLWTRSEEPLRPIREAGAITVTGAVSGVVPIPALTTSMREAITGADVVAVTVPTPALPSLAAGLVAECSPDQLLWLDPGHSGGALFLAAEFRRAGSPVPRICQLSTASHGSRKSGPAAVGVFRLSRAKAGAFPASAFDECAEQLDQLLPGQFGVASTVLELDLMNINAVMHPAQMVGNASWIEATGGAFCIYQEGTGPGLARVMDAVDAERLALADRLGVPATSFVEILRDAGYTTPDAARAGRAHPALQAGEAIRAVRAPPTLDHRYLHEDVGWGLVPWVELARTASVPCPTMDALIELAGVLNGVDYRVTGLTLERMGLEGRSPEQMLTYVRDGGA
ncbi:NAD/NADP-dependent octopine/nopaline dehydrogenase family protein [Pseudonocardia yuanmonensis]|uniref:NAD/NADP-dependent octopine/nopaline dehydrogenase family protein n=1 Tax=Pseudonocardia yuanmonensis TaxID=1095914 RepID=A0ABP8XI23_9PSEU